MRLPTNRDLAQTAACMDESQGPWVQFPFGVIFSCWVVLFSRDSVKFSDYNSIWGKLEWAFFRFMIYFKLFVQIADWS